MCAIPNISVLCTRGLRLPPPLFKERRLARRRQILNLITGSLSNITLDRHSSNLLPEANLTNSVTRTLNLKLSHRNIRTGSLSTRSLLSDILSLVLIDVLNSLRHMLIRLRTKRKALKRSQASSSLINNRLYGRLPRIDNSINKRRRDIIISRVMNINLIDNSSRHLKGITRQRMNISILVTGSSNRALTLGTRDLRRNSNDLNKELLRTMIISRRRLTVNRLNKRHKTRDRLSLLIIRALDMKAKLKNRSGTAIAPLNDASKALTNATNTLLAPELLTTAKGLETALDELNTLAPENRLTLSSIIRGISIQLSTMRLDNRLNLNSLLTLTILCFGLYRLDILLNVALNWVN